MGVLLEARKTESEQATTLVYDEGSGISFDVQPGQIVLDAGLAAGAEMPYGCRVGACGACAVEVLAGAENCERPDVIESDSIRRYHLPHQVRLACRLTCKGPLRLKPF